MIHPSYPSLPTRLPPKKQDGDEDNNDYERDGFVVGEDEAIEVAKKAEKDALEDSDSEDDDEGAAARRTKKIRKVRLYASAPIVWRGRVPSSGSRVSWVGTLPRENKT